MTEITRARSIISFSIDSILYNSSENLNTNDSIKNEDTKGDKSKVTESVDNEDSGGNYPLEKLEEFNYNINRSNREIFSNSDLPLYEI